LHVHETVTLDGTTSVFHRCRAKDCDCREFRPAAPAVRGAESEVPDLAGVLREIADLYVGKDRPHAYGFMLEAAARLSSRAAAPGEGSWEAALAEVEGHYPPDVFTPLAPVERDMVNVALTSCFVRGASDRMHAQWARHVIAAVRAARSSSSPSTTGGET
jgi:hypothetical protein